MSGEYDGTIRFNTKIDDSGLDGQLSALNGKLQSASAKLRDVMQGPVQAVQMLVAAFQKVKATLDASEAEWASQDQAIAVLKSTLKATGAEAWTSAAAVQAMASKMQDLTGYADEVVLSMQNVLLGFKNIKGDNFNEATIQIVNMAKVMKMDLTSAAQAVGKALDDPIAGVDSLTRQGFRFSAAQKEVLKDLVNTGHIAEAQKIILDELATTYGGAAAAAYETGSAVKDRLKVALSEMNEELGHFLTDGLSPFRKSLIESVKALTDFFAGINAGGSAAETLRDIATALEASAAGVLAFVIATKGAAVVDAFAKSVEALSLVMINNPYALVGAALAAIVVAILGAKKAEEEHTEAMRKKASAAKAEVDEAKALATEYQGLAGKAQKTADEQDRMATIAETLHGKYPSLTTETMNLATANGTLAEQAGKAAEAQMKLNAAQLLPGLKKDYEKAKELYDFNQNTASKMRTGARDQLGNSKEYYQAQADRYKAQKDALLDQINIFNDIISGKAFKAETPKPSLANSGNSSVAETNAEKAAKANYDKVEKLLASIAFFNKRDALHPYTEEEKKAFWESARDQLFDIDALDLGPQALELKAKVKAAVDEAFAPYGGTYGLSEATLGAADAGLQDQYDAISRRTNNEISAGPSMRTLATLGEIDQGLQELFDEVVRQIHADIAKSPTVSTLATLGDADAGLNEQYKAIVREINNAIANGPTVATLATLGESDAGLQELYDEIIRQTNNAISMGPSIATLATLGEATEGLGELFDLVVQQLNAAISKGRIIASLANEDTTGLGDQYAAMKPGLALQDALKPSEADRSDTWAVSYGRYLDEMAWKASLLGKIVDGLGESWKKVGEELEANAKDWSDVLNSLGSAAAETIGSAFEAIGQNIVDQTTGWTSWKVSALKALAAVLKSLGYQLLAQAAYNVVLGVTHLLMLDFAGAAAAAASALVAGAAAAAAFVGAGILEGLADDVEEANQFTDALDAQNDALKKNRELWTKASNAASAYSAVLTKVEAAASSFYESLQSVGADIADMLIDGIVNGLSDEDFVYSMQEYITKAVVKAAIFTETFMASVAQIGQEIASGIANGFSPDQLQGLRDRLAALYQSAAASAEVASALVESVFASYDVGALNVSGDQIAQLHNNEMVLNPGIAEEARRAGIYIGPMDSIGGAGMIPSRAPMSITATGIIQVDGRELGRVAFNYGDQFQRAAYGS